MRCSLLISLLFLSPLLVHADDDILQLYGPPLSLKADFDLAGGPKWLTPLEIVNDSHWSGDFMEGTILIFEHSAQWSPELSLSRVWLLVYYFLAINHVLIEPGDKYMNPDTPLKIEFPGTLNRDEIEMSFTRQREERWRIPDDPWKIPQSRW